MAFVYVRVWEYEVAEPNIRAFVAAYGADGGWAQLFRLGQGYLGTELYQSTADEAHFVTVDRWTSAAAWSSFHEQWRDDYDRLDAGTARLTASERRLIEGAV